MIVAYNDMAALGIVRDVDAHDLPPRAWSHGNNVRFSALGVQSMRGSSQVFGDLPIEPYAIFPVPHQLNYNWVYAGVDKIYAFNGSTHTNITRQTASVDDNYTGGENDKWEGSTVGGVFIATNGVDEPQQWLPADVSTKLTALANWPASTTCKVIRTFKSHVLALNITKSGTNFPQTLKWSHPTDPYSIPVSWDETDPTRDAGEYTFSDSGDYLVDSVLLRDVNIVYKENSTHLMQFTGDSRIFKFSKLFDTFGILSTNCAVEFIKGQHAVFARGDIIVHNGQQETSILTNRWRKWLRDTLDPSKVSKAFATVNWREDEVWFCFCTESGLFPDKALVWNWISDTLSCRDLPGASFIKSGIINSIDTSQNTWDSDIGSWDEASGEPWNIREYNVDKPSMLMAVPKASKLFHVDKGVLEDDKHLKCVIEKTGIGIPLRQTLPPDFTAFKFCRGIWPRITGTVHQTVFITLGTQDKIDGAVTWGVPQPYVISVTDKVNFTASGRLLALRFESEASVEWKLQGFELDVVVNGLF